MILFIHFICAVSLTVSRLDNVHVVFIRAKTYDIIINQQKGKYSIHVSEGLTKIV